MRVSLISVVAWSIDALIVILFLAGYAARYVHPEAWWHLQLVAVALPILSLAVLGATAAITPSGHPAVLVAHFALCVLVIVRFVPAPQMGGSGEAPTLEVLTFNSKPVFAGPQSGPEFEAALRSQTPEVVAMQELSIRPAAAGIRGDDVYTPILLDAQFETAFPDDGGEVRLPIFSTLPFRQFEQVDFVGDVARDRDRFRPSSRAEVEWQGETVVIYNVHLHSFGSRRPWKNQTWRQRLAPRAWLRALRSYREDFLIRAAQAEELRARLEAEELPFLVCGDLNSTPHNWSFAHIAADLTDAFRVAGRGWGGTYHRRLPVVRIDHILASPEWNVHRARVLRRPTSDHRPLYARLSLSPESAR